MDGRKESTAVLLHFTAVARTIKPITTTIELVIACYCVCDRSESPYNSYKKEKDIESMY